MQVIFHGSFLGRDHGTPRNGIDVPCSCRKTNASFTACPEGTDLFLVLCKVDSYTMKSWRSFLRDAPLKEGYVNKLPPLHKAISPKDFQRRYLMLLPSPLRLEYYKDESCKELKGTILLKKGDPLSHSYTSELIRETESAFALNHSDSKRTYVFLTQTEADMFSWFAKIRDAIEELSWPLSKRRLSRSEHCRPSLSSMPAIPEKEPHPRRYSCTSVDSGYSCDRESLDWRSVLLLKPANHSRAVVIPSCGGMVTVGSAAVFVPPSPSSVRSPCDVSMSVYLTSSVTPPMSHGELLLSPVICINTSSSQLIGPAFVYLPNFAQSIDDWNVRVMTSDSGFNEIPNSWGMHSKVRQNEVPIVVHPGTGNSWIAVCGLPGGNDSRIYSRVAVFGRRLVSNGSSWAVAVKVFPDCGEISRRIRKEMADEDMHLLDQLKKVPVERNACVELTAFDPDGNWSTRQSSFSASANSLWGDDSCNDDLQIEASAKFMAKFDSEGKAVAELPYFSLLCEMRVGAPKTKKQLRAMIQFSESVSEKLTESKSFGQLPHVYV
eukprot:m.181102 g.181102  ORF g.181102 m.181102 type:complete len:548 (+) comp39264_c1_seq9:80-1723(+)